MCCLCFKKTQTQTTQHNIMNTNNIDSNLKNKSSTLDSQRNENNEFSDKIISNVKSSKNNESFENGGAINKRKKEV